MPLIVWGSRARVVLYPHSHQQDCRAEREATVVEQVCSSVRGTQPFTAITAKGTHSVLDTLYAGSVGWLWRAARAIAP